MFGWADWDNVKPGDVIERKVFEYCVRSFTLVKLLELQSFALPVSGKQNWCYEEYRRFREGNDRADGYLGYNSANFYVVVAAEGVEGVRPAFFPDDYSEWYSHAYSVKALSLDGMTREKLRYVISELAMQVRKIKERVMDLLLTDT